MNDKEIQKTQAKMIQAQSDLDLVNVMLGEFSAVYCDLEFIINCFFDNEISQKEFDNNNCKIRRSILQRNSKISFSDMVWINFYAMWKNKLSSFILSSTTATGINFNDCISLLGEYEFNENMIEAEGGIELSFSKFNSINIRDIILSSADIETYHDKKDLSALIYNNVGFYFK